MQSERNKDEGREEGGKEGGVSSDVLRGIFHADWPEVFLLSPLPHSDWSGCHGPPSPQGRGPHPGGIVDL